MSGAEDQRAGGSEDPWSSAWGSWTAGQGNDRRVQDDSAAGSNEGQGDPQRVPEESSPDQTGEADAGPRDQVGRDGWVDWGPQRSWRDSGWQDSGWQGSWGQSWDGRWQRDSWQRGGPDWQGGHRWQRSGSDQTDPIITPDGSVSEGDGSGARDPRPHDGGGDTWTTRTTTPSTWTPPTSTERPGTTTPDNETFDQGRRAAPSEKMAVPTFNAESSGDELGASARSYLRQVDAWTKVTRLPQDQRALVLYQHLQGRAWIEAEELDVETLASPQGMSVFRRWVQERYQEIEVSKIAEALTQFFKRLKRQPGQTVREFNSAFDRAHTRLLEIECRLPEVARAWAYLNALSLSSSEELSLLASVNNEYNTARLQRAATLHEKSLRAPWSFRKPTYGNAGGDHRGKVKGVYHTELEDIDEEAYDVEDEAILEELAAELREASVAHEQARAKVKDATRGRSFDTEKGLPGTSAERLALAKSRSFCAGCKRRGHWHRDPECPLNQAKGGDSARPISKDGNGASSSPGKPADGKSAREAYVVHVAYELGDAHVKEGLLAITDCACSKTVAGQPWLEAYLEAARSSGLDPQLEACEEEFRFGASRVFKATYAATIHFNVLGKHFAVRASIVNGEVPLLLSRKVLASLGMIYDIAGHKASFEQLGIRDYKLRFTQTGHPALPVQPSSLPGFKFAAPKDWDNPELEIFSSACERYTAFMTFASDREQGDARANFRADGPGSWLESSASTPKTVSQDNTMCFPKKVGEVVHNMLTQEKLSSVLFCKWWANTKISNDFWIETPEAFFRTHVIPRRGVFDPSLWRTPWEEQRAFLLHELGAVRSTWAITCSNHKAVPSVHEVWRDPAVSSDPINALWIGRSVFPRKAPQPSSCSEPAFNGLQDLERMEHEQEGAHELRRGSGGYLPRELDSRGDPQCDSGRGLQGAEGPGVDDFDRTSPKSRQPLRPVPGESHKGPTPETHQGRDARPGRRDCQLRPLQEFHVQRAPRRLLDVGDQGDGSERQLLGRPPAAGQMGQEQGASERVHHTGPGGRSQNPLHPFGGEPIRNYDVVVDSRADAGDPSEIISEIYGEDFPEGHGDKAGQQRARWSRMCQRRWRRRSKRFRRSLQGSWTSTT